MQFISGQTSCPVCQQVLDISDDIVAVSPTEADQTGRSGFYHRACFERLPERRQLVANWRANLAASIETRRDTATVLAADSDYLAVFNGADESLVLYWLKHWAELRFLGPDEWGEFVEFLEAVPTDWKTGTRVSPGGRYRLIALENASIELSGSEPVIKRLEYRRDDYENHVREHGSLTSEVDFAALARTGQLRPIVERDLFERSRGIIQDIIPARDIYIVSYAAPRQTTLRMDHAALAALRAFVARIH